MADRLRQILYPLVLPLIVVTIWLCGWVRQQEDRMGAMNSLAPSAPAVREFLVAAQSAAPHDESLAADEGDGPDARAALADTGGDGADER
jgi:hypothetical protein